MKQVLINIRDVKKNIFKDILAVGGGVSSYQNVGTKGTKETDVNLEHNFISFRPSLTDPLRPEMKVVSPTFSSSSQLIGSNKSEFRSPHEVTPIDVAVVGKPQQPSSVQYSQTVAVNPAPAPPASSRDRSKLKVPKETTPIDVAVFSHNVFNKQRNTNNIIKQTKTISKPEVLVYKVEDAIKVIR